MEFRLLGPVEALVDGVTLPIGGTKPRTILAALLLQAGRPVSPAALIDEVWGDDPPPSVRNSLQVHVSAIRRALRDAGEPDRLSHDPGGYRIEVGPGELDTQRFVELVERARALRDTRRFDQAAQLLADALGQWHGDALQDVREVALAEAATGWDRRRLAAVLEYARVRLELGQASQLLELLETETTAHPLDETLHEVRMRALHQLGRYPEATTVYHRLADRLRDELGVAPSPAVRRTHQAILVREPVLGEVGQPAVEVVGAPDLDTSFVGRSVEIVEVKGLLEEAGLVTITGPGGSGKTRLAAAITTELAAGGCPTWWVDLAPLDHGEALLSTIAARVADDPEAGGSTEQLLEALRSTRGVLVLDNAEHLADLCGAVVTALRTSADQLRILVTSRVALQVEHETAWRLHGLLSPDPRSLPDVSRVRRFESVQLFAERASQVDPDFVVDRHTAPQVSRICAHLDGAPLAIELVAARLDELTPDELADSIERLLPTLPARTGDQTATARSLRRTLEWSAEQLDPITRATFARLAVFAGGFTEDAAVAVCAPTSSASSVGAALEELRRLSLLDVHHSVDLRYRFHPVVREFAETHLVASGDHEDARLRHARWIAQLCTTAGPELHGPDQERWFIRLDDEVGNIRAAVATAHRVGDVELQGRILDGAWYGLGETLGPEIGTWLLRTVRTIEDGAVVDRALHARLVHGLGLHWTREGRFARAVDELCRAIELFRDIEETEREIEAQANLGTTLVTLGRPEGLDRLRAAADRVAGTGTRIEVECGFLLSRFAFIAGEVDEAIRVAAATAPLAQQLGDEETHAALRWLEAEDHLRRDELDEAETIALDGLATARRLLDVVGEADALGQLAEVILRRGHPDDAVHVALEAVAAARGMFVIGEVSARATPMLSAVRRHRDVLRIDGHLDRLRGGQPDLVVVPAPHRPDHEAAVSTAMDQVGPEEAAAERGRGRDLTSEELIELLRVGSA